MIAESHMECHEGTVIGGNDGRFNVRLITRSACADCHVQSICAVVDRVDKIIPVISADDLKAGDTVRIIMERKMGRVALFYSYILPFFVLVFILFVLYALGVGEITAALAALASLIPYYFLIYLFREKIEKDFVFRAEKMKIQR